MSKKQKTIELGKVMKPTGKAFFSFDNSIKEIELTREYEVDGETITEKVKVAPNGEYLSGAFISKFEDNVNFKLDKGWISEKKANSDLEYGKQKSISSIFQVKVESL
jgi:hypothetical protein